MPQLKPTRGIFLNRSHPLSRGLVGLWSFNEGSGGQVFDLSGYGNIGSLVADTHWVPGKFGSALSFDGTGDYIDFGTGVLNTISISSPWSIVVWLKIDSAIGVGANNQMIAGFIDNSDLADFVAIGIDDVSPNVLKVFSEGETAGSGSLTFTAGMYHQVALVYDGSDFIVYLDGLRDYSVTPSSSEWQESNVFRVADDFNGGTSDFLDGLIDHATIYNRALSASEIAQLYREPFCMFAEAMRPKLIGGQIVNLAGSSVALSSLSATAKVMRKVGGNVVGTSDVAAVLNSIRDRLETERNWLREALFNGMTANAFKLGTTLSLGWFWVRIAGCSVLYRGFSMGEIDFVNILAVAEQDACEISPPNYISHDSGSTYFYVVRRFNNCGYQERTLAAAVRVSIESNGELAEPQPNKVFDSAAERADGNKICFVWFYCPIEQKSQPVCFNIYYDGRTGQIDYENPLATIGYKGRKFYSFQSSTLEAGKYLFAIRAEDVSGIENSSLVRLRIQLGTASPEAVDIIRAEAV